jgi:hypothetical protein
VRLNLDLSDDVSQSVFVEYIEVLKAEKDLKLWISTPEANEQSFRRFLVLQDPEIRRRVQVVPDKSKKKRPPIWTQDHEKPLEVKGKGHEALISIHIWKDGRNSGIRPHSNLWQASQQNYGYRRSPFQFEGGNVIVGSTHAFVGTDTITANMQRYKISRIEALNALSQEFHLPVVEIGTPLIGKKTDKAILDQPIFHIDMMMAVVQDKNTGRDVILLESPKAALRTLARRLPAKSNLFSRDAGLFQRRSLNELEALEPDFIDTLKALSTKELNHHQAQLDAIAEDLREQGFEVIRVPGLTAHHTGDREDYGVRHFTWTNSILSQDYVMIPGLGVGVLDDMMVKIYNGLGYRVHQMVSSQQTLLLLGGIRCVSGTYRKPKTL